ncbi:MAG TPA: M1 family metallopeptidase [Gemmatimonadales bacterium]|nr:M1 family metallopeptidase [Gemmatimonadales bacterium]
MRPFILSLFLATPLVAQQPVTPPTPPTPTPPVTTRPAPPPQRGLRAAVADTGVFAPLALPPANDLRRPDGSPGSRYWQQRVDYSIKATLDTGARRLEGEVTIRYANRSPDSLTHVWIQLDQNLFRKGSVGSYLNGQDTRFGAEGFDGGYDIKSITQAQVAGPRGPRGAAAGKPVPVKNRVDDTMMEVELAYPLAPGASTVFHIVYGFNIPEHGADRMGRDGSLYELAQWYPRMCVYDDVNGWNTLQYLGQGEFYLEYGDIDYEVTVPAGYILAGSGVLQNPLEVLTATQRSRLAAAVRSDSITPIVTEADLTSGAARPKKTGTQTWKFKATNVRDVAWAGSPEYLWDASGWQGILAQAYYRPSAIATWKDGADMSRFSIQEYSTKWFHYPYPQISAVEGPVSGMEYPMVAMESRGESKEDLYGVVTHEIGHMWYPMTVGSDERRYAWMDEGFNTFINIFSEEDYFKRDDSRRHRQELMFAAFNDQAPTAQPIMTYANRYRTEGNLGALAYVKPGGALYLLRNKVLGADVFDPAFREYTRRWAFKHPQPADFFRTMEDVSGRDLDWFWRGWFYTTDALDQAVDSVAQRPGQDGKNQVEVFLRNAGQMVMPVEVQLTYDDGTTQIVRYPVEIWYAGDAYTARIITDKPVVAAMVNPDGLLPDLVPQNNAWKAPGK